MRAFLQKAHDRRGQCGDGGEEGNAAPERAEMLGGVLIRLLFGQEREADAFCIAPLQQIDDQQIEQPQPLAEGEEVPERVKIAVQPQRAAEDQPQRGEHDGEEQQIAE